MDAIKQIFEINGHQSAFETFKREGYKNIILSTPSNEKSLCTLIHDDFSASGVVLVISPYVDRINNQIKYLDNLNITATTITSETSIDDREYIYETFNHQFFFVTPEMIAKGFIKVKDFIDDLLETQVCLVVVEEAELMMNSKVFRESYEILGDVRTNFPDIPWIALTTGSNMEIQQIATSLSMTKAFSVRLATF